MWYSRLPVTRVIFLDADDFRDLRGWFAGGRHITFRELP
jgi:hypothetical protein